MKNIVLVGASSFAQLLHQYITEAGEMRVAAFSANAIYCNVNNKVYGKPVVPLEKLREEYSPEKFETVIAVGYSHMGNIRKQLAEYCKKCGYALASFIHPSAVISKSAKLGEGNILLESVVVAPMTKIGCCNLIWNGVNIAHECMIGDYNTMSVSAALAGDVKINNNCFLGVHSTVTEHITIADYTLVGAAAYVKHDTQPYDVVVPERGITLDGKKSTDFF